MSVAVRLSRIGKKQVPFFRVVAVDSRKKRDGAFLEDLGTYDALKGSFVSFHEERYNVWVSQGALVSDTVKKLHKKHKNVSASSHGASKKREAEKVVSGGDSVAKEETGASDLQESAETKTKE